MRVLTNKSTIIWVLVKSHQIVLVEHWVELDERFVESNPKPRNCRAPLWLITHLAHSIKMSAFEYSPALQSSWRCCGQRRFFFYLILSFLYNFKAAHNTDCWVLLLELTFSIPPKKVTVFSFRGFFLLRRSFGCILFPRFYLFWFECDLLW